MGLPAIVTSYSVIQSQYSVTPQTDYNTSTHDNLQQEHKNTGALYISKLAGARYWALCSVHLDGRIAFW